MGSFLSRLALDFYPMIARINRLIGAILIVAASLYIVILNRDYATLHLSPSYQITTSAGVIFVALFCLGILASALVAVFFGFMAHLRERQLLYRERLRENFYQSMLRARSALAAGESKKAQDLWQQILRREPENVVARIELSRALEQAGDLEEALKILDAARAAAPQNVEVLFRAAEAHLALGNKTAAIDNLALALYHHPNARAAAMARDLSEELGRIDDALEYQSQAERLDPSNPTHGTTTTRLKLKSLLKSHEGSSDELLSELRTFAKRNASDPDTLTALAEHELAAGHRDEAAQALIKAARESKDLALWYRAVDLWVSSGNPERALAAARAAAKDAEGDARIDAELALARTQIALNMYEDALKTVQALPSIAKSGGVTLRDAVEHERALLTSICFNALGKYQDSNESLRTLVYQNSSTGNGSAQLRREANASSAIKNAPPPRLSTP